MKIRGGLRPSFVEKARDLFRINGVAIANLTPNLADTNLHFRRKSAAVCFLEAEPKRKPSPSDAADFDHSVYLGKSEARIPIEVNRIAIDAVIPFVVLTRHVKKRTPIHSKLEPRSKPVLEMKRVDFVLFVLGEPCR